MIIPAKLAFAAGSVTTATITVIAQEMAASKLSELIPVFVSAAVIVIPLLGAAAVAIINAVKKQGTATQEAVRVMAQTLVEKQEEVKTTIVEIQEETKADVKVAKENTNTLATAAQGREDGLRKENAMLRESVTALRQEAALLAQAAITKAPIVVMTGAAPAAAPPVAAAPESRVTLADEPIGSSAVASLKKIEVHTKETADNTAKTERDVADLKDKA